MNTVTRIAKNTFFLLLSNFVQKFFSFFLVIFVAQKLGLVSFGIYSFVFSFVVLFTSIADFGLTFLFTREVAKDKKSFGVRLGDMIAVKFFLGVVSIFFVFSLISILGILEPANYPTATIMLVLLAALSMVLDSFAGLFRAAFFAFERMELDFFANMAYKGFLIIASFIILSIGFGLWEVVLVAVIASIINLFASVYYCLKKIGKPVFEIDFSKYKSLLALGFPFLLVGLFSSIYGNIDMVMLSFLKGTTDVGLYSAAVRLVNTLSFIPIAFVSSIFPIMAVFFSQKNDALGVLLEKSIKYLLIIILPIAFGTTLLAQRIIASFYTDSSFAPAAAALQILIWFSVFTFVNILITNSLISTAFEKRTYFIIGLTALVNIIANLILIPAHGFVGASVSMVISEAFFFILGFSAASKRLYKISLVNVFAKPVIASLAMSVLIMLLSGINLLLLVSVSALAYLAFLLLLKAFDGKDWLFFSKLLGRA